MHFNFKSARISPVADVAQSVERILGKDEVTSSILVISSIFFILAGIVCKDFFYIIVFTFILSCQYTGLLTLMFDHSMKGIQFFRYRKPVRGVLACVGSFRIVL